MAPEALFVRSSDAASSSAPLGQAAGGAQGIVASASAGAAAVAPTPMIVEKEKKEKI